VDYVVKPFQPEVVLAKIGHVLQHRPLAVGTRGVSGSLSEMALPDILQILAAGRKTGRLQLRLGGGTGEIYLDQGRVVHASHGQLDGEPALFQMLPVVEGEFLLDPAVKAPRITIDQGIELLVLEAMRRHDEDSKKR
jgi:hypothetical protein